MTNAELYRSVAKNFKGRVSEDLVKSIIESTIESITGAMADGDEVKIKGLGTFYPSEYNVWKGQLEFGRESKGGKRVRVRFKPFDSTNIALTENWSHKKR